MVFVEMLSFPFDEGNEKDEENKEEEDNEHSFTSSGDFTSEYEDTIVNDFLYMLYIRARQSVLLESENTVIETPLQVRPWGFVL